MKHRSTLLVLSIVVMFAACDEGPHERLPPHQNHDRGAVAKTSTRTTPSHRSKPAVAQELFVRNDAMDVEGTHQISSLELEPRFLVATFGKPREADHQKISGRYTFVAVKDQTVFTLYDWNSTSLSEYGADLPSPKAFWASSESVAFEIGGREEDASAFTDWLLEKYRNWQQVRVKRP